VIEAAILVSRLEMLPRDKIERSSPISRLPSAKTAGAAEPGGLAVADGNYRGATCPAFAAMIVRAALHSRMAEIPSWLANHPDSSAAWEVLEHPA